MTPIGRRHFLRLATGSLAALAVGAPAHAGAAPTLAGLDALSDYGSDPVGEAAPYIRMALETAASTASIYGAANSWSTQQANQVYVWPLTGDPGLDAASVAAGWNSLAAAMLGCAVAGRTEHGFGATVNRTAAVGLIAATIYEQEPVVSSIYNYLFDRRTRAATGLGMADFQQAGAARWGSALAALATSADFLALLDAEDADVPGKGGYHAETTLYKLKRLDRDALSATLGNWATARPGSAANLAAAGLRQGAGINVFDQSYVRDYAPEICSLRVAGDPNNPFPLPSQSCSLPSCTLVQNPGDAAAAALVDIASGTSRGQELDCVSDYTDYYNALWRFVAGSGQWVANMPTGAQPVSDKQTFCSSAVHGPAHPG